MLLEEYYRPNTPDVIHEIIEGEAVMINMENGYYFSLDRIGSTIWDMLDQGTAVSRIITLLQQQYAGSQIKIEEGTYDYLIQLQTEGLIVPDVRPKRLESIDEQPAAGTNGAGKKQDKAPFVAPLLHKYTDMEDLLLLDPIHEVDETGWPAVLDKG